MNRVFIMLLDSFGIGSCKDSNQFGDEGANTFGHVNESCFLGLANCNRNGNLYIPNLTALGLGKLIYELTKIYPVGLNRYENTIGSYAYASPISMDKDTLSGHLEIMGIPSFKPWDKFIEKKNSLPESLVNHIIKESNIDGILGNCHASGTTIIQKFFEEHIQTNKPIFYTSSDSVVQIACHETVFGLNNLYCLSSIVRKILDKRKYNIGRVIARPFIGNSIKNIKRTNNRKDFSVVPSEINVMEKLIIEKQGEVIGIGKITDIFSGVGITKTIVANGLSDLLEKTTYAIKISKKNSIVFTNFSDFDSLWGHRRDVSGYAQGLEFFDLKLLDIINQITDSDLLIVTADHGCDPTWKGFDHTREFIPILLYSPIFSSKFLGYRNSFSDIAQTIAHFFSLSNMKYGKSMINENTKCY
ncbi:Phosphopentomutase [Buchnera aphidicola (Eriosoma lanigerum)]|uniref:phosphopentomutase n=1 Tax=Buchnera aphidicola TaxID=9 RepID=UPI003463FC62